MSNIQEYVEAREMADWIAEAKMQLEKGNVWLDKALDKAIRELVAWEHAHGIETYIGAFARERP